MAGTFSDWTENKVVDAAAGTATFTAATRYLALFTTNPNFETGAGGVEATGGGYVRKSIAFGAASGGSATNSAQIQWTVGTDLAAGTYTGYGIYDASGAGNLIAGDAFSANKTPSGTGDTLTFAASSVTISTT